ncbi:transcription factor HHO3-like [Cucurbita maxima]|uniref:Transcription factor HHO3-like n=1 Tax=Cucurbita maxima TaxID=3661 RepID=A0A6J1I9H5_CUCMA|nr:transcription factor HHO3-like [Cucurbita maxima]XP_022971765.1 transcription factor HHO3-like [Cucurbita maxima]
MVFSHKMQQIAFKMGFTLSDFAHTLEQERRKVLMFQRELPLCLELVTRAIDCCRHHVSESTTENRLSECSEQTSSDVGPVLEEFIPINRYGVSDSEQQRQRQQQLPCETRTENTDDSDRNNLNLCPSDWLRSAQLWKDPSALNQDLPEKTAVVEVKSNGGAFRPFQKEKTGGGGTSSTSAPAATSSTAEMGSGESNRQEEKEAQNQRKQRRCWSPELHRRFLHALQQLGGSHVATPKQIRELMKVDGLTNDEVKSHLQKYRLHTRRPSTTMHHHDTAQTPQFLVVGGIWVPAAEYATTSTGEAVRAATTNGIYAPVVRTTTAGAQALASTVQKAKVRLSGGAAECNSATTSSSTHTSSVSPAC